MSHLLISAAHKSSGKTTVCIGICAAFRQQNLIVQPFKKGPDYIDPMWLTQAAGNPCYNLDFYTQSHNEICTNFYQKLRLADIGIIEGNKGLYDGLALDGSNSNAALSVLLKTPVILVIDTSGMTRGIAPLLLGYQNFDTKVNIAGIILNKVNGARHEKKLRQVIQHYTNLPVVGAIQRNNELEILERHLGLIPSNEATESNSHIASICSIINQSIDLDLLRHIATTATSFDLSIPSTNESITNLIIHPIRIGIATGAAFGFYYPADLDAMQRYGAELIPFDPLHERELPSVDGIFIGGGFPESFMQQLEANIAMRNNLFAYIEAGRPVYAECGGLMYLSRSITWKGQTCKMVGIVPANTVMHQRPQGRGYIHFKSTAEHNWQLNVGKEIFAHEFHYSRLEQLSSGQKFAFEVLRGDGIDGKYDGIVYKNLLAGYAHLRDVAGYNWTRYFLDHVRNIHRNNQCNNQ